MRGDVTRQVGDEGGGEVSGRGKESELGEREKRERDRVMNDGIK
jgi:hypothetical protein